MYKLNPDAPLFSYHVFGQSLMKGQCISMLHNTILKPYSCTDGCYHATAQVMHKFLVIGPGLLGYKWCRPQWLRKSCFWENGVGVEFDKVTVNDTRPNQFTMQLYLWQL